MRTYIIAFIFAVFTPIFLFAQKKETIYLKSGISITGNVEKQSDGSIKISTDNGDTFFYRADELKRTGMAKKGYMGIVEAGVGYSGYYYNTMFTTVDVINGYSFSPHFFLGLGIGCNYFLLGGYCEENILTMPVYLHMRTVFLKRKVSPYFGLNAGCNFSGAIGNHLYLEPQLGVRINTSSRHSFYVSLGCNAAWKTGPIVRLGYSF